MAMVDMAANFNHMPVSTETIAKRQNIAVSYLEQIFSKLRRKGLINSWQKLFCSL